MVSDYDCFTLAQRVACKYHECNFLTAEGWSFKSILESLESSSHCVSLCSTFPSVHLLCSSVFHLQVMIVKSLTLSQRGFSFPVF